MPALHNEFFGFALEIMSEFFFFVLVTNLLLKIDLFNNFIFNAIISYKLKFIIKLKRHFEVI